MSPNSGALPHSRHNRLRVQRIAEAAVERARLTVVPRTRTKAPKVPFVMLVSAVLLAGVVGLLMFNTTMQQHAFTASELEASASDLRSQKQSLQFEIEELRSMQSVAERAQKMGMTVQGAPAFLRLDGRGGTVAGNSTEPVGLEFDATLPSAPKPKSLVPGRRIVRVQPERAATTDRTRRQITGARAGRTATGDTQRGAAAARR